jgi:ligand-binding sensor domain-containing protein
MRKLISIMTTLRALLCACFLLALAGPTAAERLPVKIYTSADGLGSSASFNLVRDSRGFIWLCSRDGLVRFDGYRFITYRIGSDDADPAVYSLLPTRNGVYWINLNTGTDYRFIDKGDATSLEPIPQQLSGNDPRIPLVNVEPLRELRFPSFEDSDGNLWGYEPKGLNLLREANGQTLSQLIELSLPGNPPEGLTDVTFKAGRNAGFWLATKETLVRRLADGSLNYFVFDSPSDRAPIRFFAEDKDSRVWIARPEGIMVLKVELVSQLTESNNLSVHRVAIKPGKVDSDGRAQLPTQPGEAFTFTFRDIFRRAVGRQTSGETTAKPTVWGIVCAADGKTWIANTGGLVLYDGKRFQHFTEEQGLASNNVSEIVEDNEGNIWLSSYAGLMRLNPRGLFAFDLGDGLAETRVNSIYEDRSGGLNFVTDNWNISKFQNAEFKTGRPRLPDDVISFWHSNLALLDSRGDWWVITSKGLYRYSGVNRIEDLDNRQPAAVYTDKNGLIANESCNVFEDSHGDLWIGSDVTSKRMGLTQWQRGTNTFQHFFTKDGLPPVAYFSAFSEDKAGSLWFGFGAAGHGGLSRLRNGSFTSFGVNDGVPLGTITNLYTDSKGRLWFASSFNTIQGNYVGTDVTGTLAVPNPYGIILSGDAGFNRIGNNVAGAGNVISGNKSAGIYLSAFSVGPGPTGNKIFSNFIGTQANGTSALGNGTNGVELDHGAQFNVIGDDLASAGNTIAFNGTDPVKGTNAGGVYLWGETGTGNIIRGNSIHSNQALGIDLRSKPTTGSESH